MWKITTQANVGKRSYNDEFELTESEMYTRMDKASKKGAIITALCNCFLIESVSYLSICEPL